MDFGVVGLGAEGVDFAAHLLGDETEFFARRFVGVDVFDEITAMIAEAHFLLGDVEFLDVEYQFLFEPVAINIHSALQLLKPLQNPLPDDSNTRIGKRLHFVQVTEDEVDTLDEVVFEVLTFLDAEFVELLDGLLNGFAGQCPFVLDFLLLFHLLHVGESQQRGQKKALVYLNAKLAGDFDGLPEISLQQLFVDAEVVFRGVGGERYVEVHLAAFKSGGNHRPDVQILAIERKGQFGVDVERLAIERANFYFNVFSVAAFCNLAVAGH